MATPGELVKVIAASTGEDLSTVASHDRNLVVAGLRSKSGRGTSAAKVTSRDAANLLTAILGSARVKDSVETVRRYARATVDQENIWERFGIAELTALPSDHTFIDALTVLITLAAEGRLIRELGDFNQLNNIKVLLTSPATHARIAMSCWRPKKDSKFVQADYGPDEPPPEWVKNKRQPTAEEIATAQPPRLRRSTEMNALPILYVGALLAGKLGELPPIAEVAA